MEAKDWIAIAGICGTLLGTLTGAFFTWQIERIHRSREDRFRFNERKREFYAEFLSICERLEISSPGDRDSVLPSYLDTWSKVQLIAPNEVLRAGDELWTAISTMKMDRTLWEKISGLPKFLERIRGARIEFENAARLDLGIEALRPETKQKRLVSAVEQHSPDVRIMRDETEQE